MFDFVNSYYQSPYSIFFFSPQIVFFGLFMLLFSLSALHNGIFVYTTGCLLCKSVQTSMLMGGGPLLRLYRGGLASFCYASLCRLALFSCTTHYNYLKSDVSHEN